MTVTIDLQAIDRGLGALAGLLQNTDVRAVVTVFRTDFLAASQQIDMLSDYKDLHDLLHDIQFYCYKPIASQAARFPADELVVDALEDHELTFRGLVAKLTEVVARPTMSGELNWIVELTQAQVLLEQALETKDPAALKNHCRLVRRVLDRYPSLINARLNGAARALRMDVIERAMVTILDILKKHAGASSAVTSFASGTASLADLSQRLACLVRDHDRWQDVDVELRGIETTLNSDPEELLLSWPGIKSKTESLLCGEDETKTRALRQEGAHLEEALQANDPQNTRRHFSRFQRHVAEHFYRVDDELKTLCGQLRTLGAPLAAVARLVAAIPLTGQTPVTDTGLAVGVTSIQRGHLELMLEEVTRRYNALTGRIAARDRDIANTLDGEQALVLKQRRADLAAERDELAAIRAQYEAQLNALNGAQIRNTASHQGARCDE